MRPVNLARPSTGWRTSLAVLSLGAALAACADAPAASPEVTTLEPRASLAGVQASGAATNIALAATPTVCLAIRNGLIDDTYVGTTTCNTSSTLQRFTLASTGQLRSASDPRWCVDISGQRGNDGDPLVLGYCASVTSQRWTVTASSELKSQLATGRCITSNGTGAIARMRGCGAYPARQRWVDAGASGGTTTPAPVARVDVAPASLALTVGQSGSLTATPRDANGNALTGRTITWSSSATGIASVSSGGTVTAVASGSATISATVDGVSGSSAVTVTATAPAPVASVSVSLATGTLNPGQTTQATATTRDAGGNVLTGRAIAWTSSNTAVATVSGSGLVTAVAAGTASITASSEGKSGSATLTVQAATTPGVKIDTIFRDGFESGNLSLWQDGVDPTKHRVTTSNPRTGSYALEITTSGGDGGWLTRFFMPGYDSAYVRFYVRYGTEWTGGSKLLSFRGSPINNQWGGFGNAGKCPNGTDFFSGNLTTDGGLNPTAPGYLRLYSYYPAMPKSGTSCWGDYGGGRGATYADANGATPALSPSTQWHLVEYFFKLNRPGSTDAFQAVWVDGRKVAEWGGISFRTTTDLRVNSVQLNISGATGTQRVYFDDIVVMTGRPGGTQ